MCISEKEKYEKYYREIPNRDEKKSKNINFFYFYFPSGNVREWCRGVVVFVMILTSCCRSDWGKCTLSLIHSQITSDSKKRWRRFQSDFVVLMRVWSVLDRCSKIEMWFSASQTPTLDSQAGRIVNVMGRQLISNFNANPRTFYCIVAYDRFEWNSKKVIKQETSPSSTGCKRCEEKLDSLAKSSLKSKAFLIRATFDIYKKQREEIFKIHSRIAERLGWMCFRCF